MKKSRRLISIIICSSIITSLLFFDQKSVVALDANANDAINTSIMDKEILDMYGRKYKQMNREIYLMKISLDSFIDVEDSIKKIESKYENIVRSEEFRILEMYGYEDVGNADINTVCDLASTSSSITPKTTSNAVEMIDNSITYNRTTQLWRYSGSYHFLNPLTLDTLPDIEDIMSVSLTDDTNFTYWYSSAGVWNVPGTLTGSVYTDGSNSLGSHITLRNNEKGGVIFNVIDKKDTIGGWYPADYATIFAYFKKTSGFGTSKSTKIFTTFNHNFKNYAWNADASISFAGLNATSGALNVTYSAVNGNWQRASVGINITDGR